MERGKDDRRPSDNEAFIGVDVNDDDVKWLKKAQDAYAYTTDYMDDGIRSNWENNLRRFQSLHPHGSKYNDDSYAKRSKIFRPKIRSAERRTGALAASALFQNEDLVDVRGQNKRSREQAASAAINKELLQYRLSHSVPWFTTALGARQDTFNYGPCISFQTWDYETVGTKRYIPEFDESGNPIIDEEGRELGYEEREVLCDEPSITLIKNENFRFDPNADWRDPVKDSPVLIWQIPMYAGDVLSKMGSEEDGWKEYELSTVLATQVADDQSETVRQSRMGDKRDDPQNAASYGEQTMVWVHLNIVKDGGLDYAYYTLGTKLMLSDPMPVEELLPLGRESFVVGFSVIDTHKNYPVSENELAAPLSDEMNDVANQRMDNVKLALNKRYVIKRNAQVDLKALARNVPGGGVFAGDVDDVRVIETPDVTASSYQEQDRLAQELDELLGNFSASSVQSNRALGETVGGMNLVTQDANSIQELALRCWVETWVEPVLRNFQKLEARFETDEVILSIAGENAELFQKYGIDVITDELLDQELTISVNVGLGSSSPQQKMERINAAVQSVAQLPEMAERLDAEEIAKEIFGAAGYSDGSRFIIPEEEFMEKQERMAAMEQPPQTQVEAASITAQASLEKAQIEAEAKIAVAQIQSEGVMGKTVIGAEMETKKLKETTRQEDERLQTQRDSVALKERNKIREMNIKERQGSGV